MAHDAMFGWHEAESALVFTLNKMTVMITVADLRRQGWTITPEGLRATLPRVDKTMVVDYADPLMVHKLGKRGYGKPGRR